MTLALQYRPRILADLRGQEHVNLVLGEVLRRWKADEDGVVPAGMLFAGPRGCGKTSTARILAAGLNCEGVTDTPPCGECPACRDAQTQRAESVLELDGASSGRVEDVRDLRTIANVAHHGRYRVIICDEVHALSDAAFSALLKQLEEPPPRVLYVLVTTDPQMVPAAITSRCLVFSFGAIPEAVITSRLAEVCAAEGWKAEPEALTRVAKRARGALRDALMALEQLALSGEITSAQFMRLWPGDPETFAREFIDTAQRGDIARGVSVVQSHFASVRDAPVLIDAVVQRLRDLAVEATGPNAGRSNVQIPRLMELFRLTWDARVRLRAAPPHDPTLLELLWFLFAGQFGTVSRQAVAAPRPFVSTLSPVQPMQPQSEAKATHKALGSL